MSTELPKIIVVVGQTASGKSALGMELARHYNGEIICADSRTIYRGMDIGTAKPSEADQHEIPHHLLDIADPDQTFSAAQFKDLALKTIHDISSRGKLPIIVGGTGLYVDAIIFDYQFAGSAKSQEREALEARSIEELQALLREKNIPFPENDKNKRHLVRLLERGEQEHTDRESLRANTLVLGIEPSRSQLRKRIEERVEQMFRAGLRKEVDELIERFDWGSEALKGIGYREFEPYYRGEISMSQVKQKIIQDTLQFAKRQRTWFRRNKHIIWLESPQSATDFTDQFLS